ncbi:class I SAM-dependent methyltransferase [Nocardia sp. NPDC051911]|uniref:class I SAM-dependent methyltransferase n=1 Tax=Nocardia sp. NPDC051911 TaxID=3154648 RepID=UPI00343E06E2
MLAVFGHGPVLEAADARPLCARHVVAADLRGDWVAALRVEGFRADVPTHWVDEGVLGYLRRADALRVVTTLTELSAPESRFGVGKFDTDQHSDRYTELRWLVRAGGDGPREPSGLGPGAEQWLAEHGWRTEFRAWDDLVAPLERHVLLGSRDLGVFLAVRRQRSLPRAQWPRSQRDMPGETGGRGAATLLAVRHPLTDRPVRRGRRSAWPCPKNGPPSPALPRHRSDIPRNGWRRDESCCRLRMSGGPSRASRTRSSRRPRWTRVSRARHAWC